GGGRVDWDAPVGPWGAHRAIARCDCAGRRGQQLDAPDDGAWTDDEPVPNVAGHGDRIDFAVEKIAGEQRADFGREEKRARSARPDHAAHVDRLDPEAVPGEEELSPPGVPEGEGEHPAQAVDALRAPAAIGLEDDLCIGARSEAGAFALELPA